MDNALDTGLTPPKLSLGLKPIVLALAMPFGMTVGSAASAANFTVTNLNDAGLGSLRQAIADANAAPGADTITFAAGLSGSITLTTGQLTVTDSVTIQGPGSNVLTVSGNNASRVLELYSGLALLDITISGLTIAHGFASTGAGIANFDEILTLDDVTLADNHATSDGGALWLDGFSMVVTVRNSVITGNTAGQDGGGVYVEDTGGPMLFQNTVISNNQAGRHGGGIYFYDPDQSITIDSSTISGNVAGQRGGGIYLYGTDGGSFTIRNSTISGNQAQRGGGIYLYDPRHPVAIENSTISGNTATLGNGGGLNVNSHNGLRLTHVTVAGNTASGQGGGFFHDGGTTTLVNALFAGNSAASPADGHDIFNNATLNAQNSLIQNAPAGTINGTNTANLLAVAPLLGPLANNGGPTLTQALLVGSPAINAGTGSGVLTTDQRGTGFARTSGAAPDIGAFERQAAPAAHQVPTLSQWVLGLLAGLLAWGARTRGRLRRQP